MTKWKPWALMASWAGWWVLLALWGLGSAIGPIMRVTQPDAKGSVNVSFGDGAFHATVSEGTTTAWQGDISFLKLVLLIGLPPLILWIVWLWAQKRADRDPVLLGEGDAQVQPTGTRETTRLDR